MDSEHNYYQNNLTTKPTKAYYLNVLQHEMGDYSQADVDECIAAYHAAEENESSEKPSESMPPSPGLEQFVDHQPENYNTGFPAVGGSSWFHNDGGTEGYDVYYHHLVGETPTPTPTAKNLTSLIPQRGETVNLEQFQQASGKNPTSLILQRSETAVLGQIGQEDPTSLISQRSETVVLDRFHRNPTSQNLKPTVDKKPTSAKHHCRFPSCGVTMPSRNQLHRHLKEKGHFTAENPTVFLATDTTAVVKPTKQPFLGTGYAFRGFRYAELRIRSTPTGEDHSICVDSGCGMTVADELWFRETFPQAHTAAMPTPIRIRGIASDAHLSNLYSVVTIFVPGQRQGGELVLMEVEVEVHLVQGLKCNMLIGVDMLKPYGMSLDFGSSTLRIPSCEASAPIRTKPVEKQREAQRRKVKVSERTIVSPYSRRAIPIKFRPFAGDGDFNFRPTLNQSTAYLSLSGAFLESVCSNSTSAVYYHNKTDRPVIFSRSLPIGELTEFEADTEAFFVDAETAQAWLGDPYFAAESHPPVFPFPSSAVGMHLSAEAYLGIGDRLPKATEERLSDAMAESILDDIGPPPIGSSIDDIQYGPDLTADQVKQLKELVRKYRKVWEKTDGVVDEPPEDWLKIRVKKGANLKSRGVYRLGAKDREVVDELFDKLCAEGKMSKCEGVNPVGWGVFVVRTGRPGDKGRVVVDTRGLNAATEDDAYPLPRQDDVMGKIRWRRRISLFDQIKSYYQRVIEPESRPYTAVVTHRGHEWFNVALMGYKGSVAHQQKYIDKLLEEFLQWASSYIDDIVVASYTFEEHLTHLELLFDKMEQNNLALNPKKCRVAFERVQLLGHVVDQYGIYTMEAKTAAIREMAFPATLADLEYFLGLTGYYRQFVPFYSLRAAPLRKLASDLTKPIRRTDQKRSVRSNTVKVPPPTKEQLESFQQLKDALSSERFLIHDDPSVPLMMSIDASYEYGFGVAVYQVPRSTMEEFEMTVEQIQKGEYDRRRDRVLMFLSKELTPAKGSYWPTELETSALVFAVKKTRHLVEANDYPTIIYTDHVAVRHIAHSTTLKTSSPERANMRLIRGSQYLSQFRLDVRYTPGKNNIVADALSRLKRVEMKADIFTVINDIIPDQNRPENTVSLIHMSPGFLERWSDGLREDRHYRTIFEELAEKIGDADEVEAYGWLLRNKNNEGNHPLLFVRKGEAGGLRACVPATLVQELLKAAHDRQGHPGTVMGGGRSRQAFYALIVLKTRQLTRKTLAWTGRHPLLSGDRSDLLQHMRSFLYASNVGNC